MFAGSVASILRVCLIREAGWIQKEQLAMNFKTVLCRLYLMLVLAAALSGRVFETGSGVVEKVVFLAGVSQGYEIE